jgi:hypothetical protein
MKNEKSFFQTFVTIAFLTKLTLQLNPMSQSASFLQSFHWSWA